MSTEQQQPETQVLDLSGGLLSLTAENGWVDVMAQLKAEASKLAPSTFILARSLRNEDAIASPESYDVKTDPMALPIVPLSELVKSKKIRKASDLSAAELIDTADILLCHFAAYCRGIAHSSTIDTCAYVHDLALTEGTPLSPFVSSVLKLMVFVAHIVESGGIRDGEEEFSQAFTATVLGYEAAKGQVLEYDELDAPAADAANPLVVRFAFLRDLAKFFQQVAETQRSGATQTHEAFASSLEKLSTSIVALRAARKGDDVIKGPTGVFNEMGTRWNAMMTPQPAVDSQVWSESLDFYARVAEETAAGTQQLFAARNDLMEIYRRVKAFASREVPPLLLSRSCVAIFLFQHEKPFGGEHALVLLFNYLKEQCGAPWFLSFALLQTKEENDLVDACVKYAISVTGTQMPQRSTPAYDDVKRRILMGNTSIGVEVSRLMLGLCQAYLRNRGRCHRDLLNILANIAQVNNTAISLERSLFAMATPSVTQTHAAALMKCEVVSNLVSWLLFDTCHTICNLTQSLGLLTHAELLGVAWFYQAFEMCKAECEAVLYPLEVMDVKDRRAAVLPPIVLARTAVARNGPHAQSLMLRELKIGVAKANVISLASLLSRIPQCKMPDRSLQTVSNIFNHRFVQILEAARRPYIVAWDDIIRNVKMFTTDTTDKSTKLAVDQFKTAASRATALREAVVDPIDVAFLRAVEEAAKKNAVVVGVAAKMNREVEVNVHPLFPEVLSYALKAAAAAPAPKVAA